MLNHNDHWRRIGHFKAPKQQTEALKLVTLKDFIYWIVTLGVITFLTSCASSPSQWYRIGATAQDFEHDQQACNEAVLSTGTTSLNASVYSFEECMERKGWTILKP